MSGSEAQDGLPKTTSCAVTSGVQEQGSTRRSPRISTARPDAALARSLTVVRSRFQSMKNSAPATTARSPSTPPKNHRATLPKVRMQAAVAPSEQNTTRRTEPGVRRGHGRAVCWERGEQEVERAL